MNFLRKWLRLGFPEPASPIPYYIEFRGRILIESERFSDEEIAKIEKKYSAKYVCETCVKNKTGWVNRFVSIFYQPDPSKVPAGKSQWFGIFWQSPNPLDLDYPSHLMICNAITAVEQDITGIVADNGDIIYSRFRHDYRWSPDMSVMIDGGRDYDRHNNGGPLITLRIIKDKLCVVDLGGTDV